MQMPAGRVRPGYHLDGAEVLWVSPVPLNGTVVIALDAEVSGQKGAATRLHRYPAEHLLEVDTGQTDRAASAS